ncbi:MAG: hypothetical protein QG585_147 [Patescibacteria group bacterium]|nr:hypothetical protein [Patescibacteria group bacterium]
MENPIEKVEKAIENVEEKVFEKVTPDNLPSFFDVLKSAYNFCLEHKKLLFLYFFIPLLVSAFVHIFGNLFFSIAFKSGSVVAIAVTALLVLAISLAVGVFNAIVTYGSSLFIKSLEDGKKHSLKNHYRDVLGFGLPIVLTSIVTVLMLIGGGVLFIIPGIILMLASFFALNAVVLENKKTKDALVRSFTLTRNKKLYLFVQSLGLAVVVALVSLVALLVSVILFAIFRPLLSVEIIKPVYLFVSTVFHQAVSAGLISFAMVFFYKLYKNLSHTVHHVTGDYVKKVTKLIYGFAIFGVVVIVGVILLSVILKPRIESEFNRMQIEKQIEAQIKNSLANPVK